VPFSYSLHSLILSPLRSVNHFSSRWPLDTLENPSNPCHLMAPNYFLLFRTQLNYKPLIHPNKIRVLHLEPGLGEVKFSIEHLQLPNCACVLDRKFPRIIGCPECRHLNELPRFGALSYAWGSQTDLKEIVC
jgi:hypothetical protein